MQPDTYAEEIRTEWEAGLDVEGKIEQPPKEIEEKLKNKPNGG